MALGQSRAKMKIVSLSILIFLVAMFLLQIFNGVNKQNALLDGIFGIATINKVENASSFRKSVCYSFNSENVTYKDCEIYNSFNSLLEKKLLNCKVPIIFSKHNPGIHKILILKVILILIIYSILTA